MLFPAIIFLLLLAGYFVPVSLALRFIYGEDGVRLRLGISMLHGLWRKERVYQGPADLAGAVRRESETETPLAEARTEGGGRVRHAGLMDAAAEALRRLDYYGVGGALFSYFIPARYLPWLDVAGRLERRGRFTRLRWATSVGLDDAAGTALAAGLLFAAKGSLLSWLNRRYRLPRAARIDVHPFFAGYRLESALECIFQLRLGHIIRASLRGFLLDKLRGSVPSHDERSPDRGPHENGHAKHQRNGGRQHDPWGSGGNARR
ncbi:MAG: DUF2953 domain-containing protein [Bacteroidota bacterium]